MPAAIWTTAASIASFLAIYALCVRTGFNASPAILAAALCIGMMRENRAPTVSAFAARLVALPLVALAAGFIGALLLRVPVAGAALFTGGVTLSVALRHYGERAAQIGRLIALPLLAILFVPVVPAVSGGTPLAALLAVAAGIVALCISTIASYALRRARPATQATSSGSNASLRMAAQMCVALAVAFAAGLLFFPAHWAWIVLSAFIVCSGAVGRGDALYKAVLRLGGAIGGTLAAALISFVHLPNMASYAALVFFVLFLGIRLRQINYAYWAACATLIFALLQGPSGAPATLFATRVLCIVIGALCGVFAAWFVYPIRTRQLVRKRIADALGAMRGVLGGEEHDLERHAAQLERIAPPLRMHRSLFRQHEDGAHPAALIEDAQKLLAQMRDARFDRKDAGAKLKRLGGLISKRD